MQPETVRYLIELVQERRDQAAFIIRHGAPATPALDHWHAELRRANDAYAVLARMPIA